MSTFTLKMIACITMLIDHLTYFFVPEDSGFLFQITIGGQPRDILWVVGRTIGRIAFPIFAFLIVEGFYHTKNLKKYIMRLSLFAVIAELPYYWAFWYPADITNPMVRRSIMITLLLGLLTVALLDEIYKAYIMTNPYFMNIFMVMVIICGGLTLIFLRGSYQEFGYGVLLMVGFYLGHPGKKQVMVGVYLVHRSNKLSVILFILIVGFLRPNIEFMAILAAPILYFYNGQKGRNVKYLFYIFYPAHLLILCLIRSLIE